jgi:hypothetical protein
MATAAATHSTQAPPHRPTLFLAFELGVHTWKLGLTPGAAQRPRERRMPAGAVQVLLEESVGATQRFGLPAEAPVMSGDEAGRDGLWLHRF